MKRVFSMSLRDLQGCIHSVSSWFNCCSHTCNKSIIMQK
ncbi:hypothetical protein [Candidatus Enterovibrio altilux]